MAASSTALAVYNRKLFKNPDWTLIIITAVLGVCELLLILWGINTELPQMSQDQAKEFFARRYQTIQKVEAPPVEVTAEPEVAQVANLPAEETAVRQEEATEQLEKPAERQQQSVQEQREARRQRGEERQSRRAAMEQQVINNQGGVALVVGQGTGSGASDLVDAARVTAGEGIGMTGVTGLVTGSQAEDVRRLRTDAPTGGGSGGVDLGSAISAVDAGVAGGTVGDLRMGEVETYDRSGKFTAEAARSPKALDGVISGYTPGLKDCFEQQLRRQAGLNGSILVRFTIAPDGSVKDVNFTQNRWSDERAGQRVESCMKRKVQSWQFDPVDASLGDFKAGRKFTFGS
ncbi:MAG: AgmX/PglI C-terminal domain-containing protein [Calditrichaeota bacterium]|nr:AgmX/PglI C-terminal domain-containing protein [Calditrichota bacterium]